MTLDARKIQYLLASVFLVLGGGRLLAPQSVAALTITTAYGLGLLQFFVFDWCFCAGRPPLKKSR